MHPSPRSLRRFGLWTVFVVLALMITAVDSPAKVPSLARLQTSVDELEAVVSGEEPGMSAKRFTKQMDRTTRDLGAYMESHPEDLVAPVLSVRLRVLQQLTTPSVLSPGEEQPDVGTLFAPEHKSLERVLRKEPDNAEAHYWTARLWGMGVPRISEEGRLVKDAIDLDKAIESSRKAVELAPGNVQYREALSLYLVDGQHWEEALGVMATQGAKESPVYELLTVLESLPVPDGAIFSKEDTDSYADQQMSRGRFEDYPQLRVRVYLVPVPASEIEAFYRRHWSDFTFLSQRPEGPFAQYLRPGKEGLQPVADMSGLPTTRAEADGIALTVMEMRDLTEEERTETSAGHALPSDFGEVFSYLFLVNHRPLASGS